MEILDVGLASLDFGAELSTTDAVAIGLAIGVADEARRSLPTPRIALITSPSTRQHKAQVKRTRDDTTPSTFFYKRQSHNKKGIAERS